MDKIKLVKFGGIASIIGCISAVLADFIGILIYEEHNPIKQTISQLAHGKYAYIQDIGLTIFGFSIVFASIALYIWKSNSIQWVLGIILLSLMGICTIVLAEFNQFAGEPGTTIHIVIALAIGLLFTLCTFLLSINFKNTSKTWYLASVGLGIAFLVACSGFLIISEKYEGIYERGVALLVTTWFIILGYNLIKISNNLTHHS